MLDTLKNALFASLGLVAITQEKLRNLVDESVKRGELTAEQGKKLVEDLLQRSQSEGKALSDRIAHEVLQVLEKSPFASRRDMGRLEERVRALESKLGMVPESGSCASSAIPSDPTSCDGACSLDEDVGV